MTEQHASDHSGTAHEGSMATEAAELELQWAADPRWSGVARDYSAADVVRLRGSAAHTAMLAYMPVMMSAIGMPTRCGPPPFSPVTLMMPPMPWIMKS